MGQWSDIVHMDRIIGVHMGMDHVHWFSKHVLLQVKDMGDMIYSGYSFVIVGVIVYVS